ncbi:Bud site selection protein 6 [Coemansia sp. RSA 2399]|nr:Bud site selection protein 6 [Coemansia sp. RSA 2399]KAJ1908465.1 Bud site selection protein 6 [Coemansia sp. IMI 209127]
MNRDFTTYQGGSGADGQSPEPADYTVYGGATRPLGSAMTRAYGATSNYGNAGPISTMGSLRSTRSTAGNKPQARRAHEYLQSNSEITGLSSHLQPFVADTSGGTTAAQAGPTDYGYHRRMTGASAGRPTSSRSTAMQQPPASTSFGNVDYVPRTSSMRKYNIAGDYEDTRATQPPFAVSADAYSRRTSSRMLPATTAAIASQRVDFGYTSPTMMVASRSPERDDEIADIIADMSKTRITAQGDSTTNESSAEDVDTRNRSSPVRFVFLQLGDDTRKAVIDGPGAPSHVELVNLFIDKFQGRLAENPNTVPSVYLKDPASGVFYELEDTDDVATGSLLQWRPAPLVRTTDDSGTLAAVEALAETVRALSATVTQLPAQMKAEIDGALGSAKQHADHVVSEAIVKTLGQITALLGEGEPSRLRTQDTRTSGDGDDADAIDAGLVVAGPSNPSIARSASMPSAGDARLADVQSKLRKAELALSVTRQEHQAALAAVQGAHDALALDMDKLRKDVASHPNVLRVRIEEGKTILKADYRALNTRFEDVDAMVQEMRKDVTQRGAIPTQHMVRTVESEIAAIEGGTKRLLAFINDTRADWKRTWEEELQNILKEQGFVKDVEQLLGELKDDNSDLAGVVDKLDKVIDFKQQERTKEGYVPPAATRFLDVVSADDAPDAKKSFLMQISCVDVDHARRLDALDAAEKLRRKELLASKVNEFDEELSDFVGQQKLRKTGGTEELERRRAEKEIEVMKDMLKSVEEVELARREKLAQRKAVKKKPMPPKATKKKKTLPVSADEIDATGSEPENNSPVAEDASEPTT